MKSKLISVAVSVLFGAVITVGCNKDKTEAAADAVAPAAAVAAQAAQPAAAPQASERDRYVKAAVEIGCAAKAGKGGETAAIQAKHGFDATTFATAAGTHAAGAAGDIAKGLGACP